MLSVPRFIVLIFLLLIVSTAAAEDAYYSIPLQKLTIADGALPQRIDAYGHWQTTHLRRPYAALDSGGECYMVRTGAPEQFTSLAVAATAADQFAGTLVIPGDDGTAQRLRFTVAPADFAVDRPAFLRAKLQHYQELHLRRLPGRAWLRHQIRTIQDELGEASPDEQNVDGRGNDVDDLASTFALFTGGRAVSENLQLDRALPPAEGGEDTVALSTIAGITVQEMDWTSLTKDLNPQLDPLASIIPADQHALFFANFPAMQQLLDRAQQHGSLVLLPMEADSEDALTQHRYERQLCLPLGNLSRALGPYLTNSIAFTGSDPYLRIGSDVAVLFEATNPQALSQLLKAQLVLAQQANQAVKPADGQVDGVAYSGAISADRAVCSYHAVVGNFVVVTNSLAQLKRIVAVHKAQAPALASLPEYKFSRDRYKRGDETETALLILSDATIRRWCGPRWRIADSRRTRAAAVMLDLQAQNAKALADRTAAETPLTSDRGVPQVGDLRLTSGGVVSSTYGTLAFMTPIAELELDKVSQAEANAYGRWRATYQQNWRQFFDPIACRFTLTDTTTDIDLTVMPLIAATEYRPFIDVTSGASLQPSKGDPHDAIAHLALAINPDSPTLRGWGRMMQNIAGDLRIEPLAWLGSAVALYADDDPFWTELAAAPDTGQFLEENYQRLPIALYAESRDALRLAGFLTMVRAYADQSAPGLLHWETLRHGEQPYAKITAREGAGDAPVNIYYASLPKALILTMNEQTLKRAMDRQAPATQPATQPTATWLGENLCLVVRRPAMEALAAAKHEDATSAAQAGAWSNIPILNEWHRIFPDRDPVEVHQQLWNVRLTDPAGGQYTWNQHWHTMQSSIYGHPGEPKSGVGLTGILSRLSGNFGLTFENNGLRARAQIEESPASKQ